MDQTPNRCACACLRTRAYCCLLPPLASFDYAWSSDETRGRDRVRLGAVRLAYGVALVGFSVWAWAALSSPADFADGYGDFGRTVRRGVI